MQCGCKDANLEQVRAGMAWAHTKYLTDQAVFDAERLIRRECLPSSARRWVCSSVRVAEAGHEALDITIAPATICTKKRPLNAAS